MTIASEIMSKNPVTVDVTSTVTDALTLLHDLNVRHLPVVDGSSLVGIVSDRDLREFAAPAFVEDDQQAEIQQKLATPITEVMASNVSTLDLETDIGEAIDMMLEYRVGAVPVVSSRSQELVGIVSYVDVLRAVRDLV